MSLNYPNWVSKMDAYYHAKTPFIAVIQFDPSVGHVYTDEECLENKIYYDFDGQSNWDRIPIESGLNSIEYIPPKQEVYRTQFDRVANEIKLGNTYLLNLCSSTELVGKLDLFALFSKSNARFRMYYKDEFVVFSPERFIRSDGYRIRTFPMKGTMDAAVENAHELLANDEKELAEHHTIVDLMRNDIGSVCEEVRVSRFGYIETIETSKGPVLQMSSEIEGVLSSHFRKAPGRMLYSLLPAGSISGAPKQKTVEIIREVETMNRGFYTGIMVRFDGETIDSGVMIRFIEKDLSGKCFYKSGGGITFRSEVQKEYDEIIRKVYLPFL